MRLRDLLAVLLLAAVPGAAADAPLPRLGADPAQVSVSGLSSGAFMAVQYGVAYSASTIGVGVIAGGPFDCARVHLNAIDTCMKGAPGGAASLASARYWERWERIDPLANLARQRIYLFSGTNDDVVARGAMDGVREFYALAGVPEAQLRYETAIPAGHAFVSADLGGDCAANAPPFINECTVGGALYDQPKAVLTHIYGALAEAPAARTGKLVRFDQRPFLDAFLLDTGYAYVPADCTRQNAKCRVHVVFHGCEQSADYVGDKVYERLGYNDWADTNRIIVLYPQAGRNSLTNPMGCWDWWGYSGIFWPTRTGQQILAVRKMVERLTTPN